MCLKQSENSCTMLRLQATEQFPELVTEATKQVKVPKGVTTSKARCPEWQGPKVAGVLLGASFAASWAYGPGPPTPHPALLPLLQELIGDSSIKLC